MQIRDKFPYLFRKILWFPYLDHGLYYRHFDRTFLKIWKKAQIIEEQKRANRRKELERNKHRVPDGVVPEDFAKFQPHMPYIL